MLKCTAVIVAACAGLTASSGQAPIVDSARALLLQGIVAAGGRDVLARHSTFGWHGKATIHAGERRIQIEGDWQVEPPDRSKVVTYEADKGPGSARAMIIDGGRGWSVIGGKEQPLPDAMLGNERDQFYLYYLLRLEPILRDGSRLLFIPPEADGNPGIRVSHAGRRDVDIFFNKESHRVDRMRTRVADPASGQEVLEELRFTGTMESNGVRWFRDLMILQDQKPFFALTLSTFTTLSTLDLSR